MVKSARCKHHAHQTSDNLKVLKERLRVLQQLQMLQLQSAVSTQMRKKKEQDSQPEAENLLVPFAAVEEA